MLHLSIERNRFHNRILENNCIKKSKEFNKSVLLLFWKREKSKMYQTKANYYSESEISIVITGWIMTLRESLQKLRRKNKWQRSIGYHSFVFETLRCYCYFILYNATLPTWKLSILYVAFASYAKGMLMHYF